MATWEEREKAFNNISKAVIVNVDNPKNTRVINIGVEPYSDNSYDFTIRMEDGILWLYNNDDMTKLWSAIKGVQEAAKVANEKYPSELA